MSDRSDQWVPEIFESTDPESTQHILETERLILRPISRDHIADYAALVADPDVMRYVGLVAGQVLDHAQAEDLVVGAAEAWLKRGYGRWSVYERDSGEFVGFTGFRCEQGIPELICLLHKKFWGGGYATEASLTCLDYGFTALGFTEVCAYCRPTNDKARRLMERLGGEFIGITDFHGVEGAAFRFLR
jgi:[ribosomal protein S5]-alanine N-acetyltransferase